MTQEDLQKIINYIVSQTVKLKDRFTKERNIEIDYICVFSQTDQEYLEFKNLAAEIRDLVWDSPTGPVYNFKIRPQTLAGRPKLLRIRIPDKTKPERGDTDFNINYSEFKKKYFDGKRFTLIVREDFEMLELMDNKYDIRAYFSSTPLSKTLRIT